MTGWAADLAQAAVGRHGAMQKPAELACALELVAGLAAERLCEIGAGEGGTLWAWAQLGIPRRYAVTLPVPGRQYVHAHGAELLWADSHDPASLGWLHRELGRDTTGRPAQLDVLFIDGDHTAAGCAADFADYGPFVRPGGLILIHDVAHPALPGPRAAWELITATRPGCEILPTDPAGPVGFGVIHVTRETFR